MSAMNPLTVPCEIDLHHARSFRSGYLDSLTPGPAGSAATRMTVYPSTMLGLVVAVVDGMPVRAGLTPAAARQIATALMEAAAEIDPYEQDELAS